MRRSDLAVAELALRPTRRRRHPPSFQAISLDPNRATWRMRGGRYVRPKITTKDLSKLDLSAQAAKNIDLSREGVTAALVRAADGLPPELMLGLRSAVLRERHVLKARRRELLGDVNEEQLGTAEAQARDALERALVAEYGFLPRFQLRWVGAV